MGEEEHLFVDWCILLLLRSFRGAEREAERLSSVVVRCRRTMEATCWSHGVWLSGTHGIQS